MEKLYECTCRFCGEKILRQRSNSTLCDNPECRKKAKAENDKRYRMSEKGKATVYKNHHSERYKATRKLYEQTEAYKKSKSERAKKYRLNPHVAELDRVRKLRYYYRKYSALRYFTIEGADAITLEEFKSFYDTDICYYCGKKIEKRKTIDHKTPVSRGGTNKLENLCICCQSCNSSKGNKTEAEYNKWRKQNEKNRNNIHKV